MLLGIQTICFLVPVFGSIASSYLGFFNGLPSLSVKTLPFFVSSGVISSFWLGLLSGFQANHFKDWLRFCSTIKNLILYVEIGSPLLLEPLLYFLTSIIYSFFLRELVSFNSLCGLFLSFSSNGILSSSLAELRRSLRWYLKCLFKTSIFWPLTYKTSLSSRLAINSTCNGELINHFPP